MQSIQPDNGDDADPDVKRWLSLYHYESTHMPFTNPILDTTFGVTAEELDPSSTSSDEAYAIQFDAFMRSIYDSPHGGPNSLFNGSLGNTGTSEFDLAIFDYATYLGNASVASDSALSGAQEQELGSVMLFQDDMSFIEHFQFYLGTSAYPWECEVGDIVRFNLDIDDFAFSSLALSEMDVNAELHAHSDDLQTLLDELQITYDPSQGAYIL